MLVNGVNPIDLFGPLDRVDVRNVHDDRLIIRAHDDAFERLVTVRVNLLVRHVWRDVDEIARPGFRDELKSLAHARPSAHHVNYALSELAMMVDAGLRVRLNRDGTSPDLLGPDPGVVDRGLPKHAGSLGCVGIEPVPRNNPYTVVLPARFGAMVLIGMIANGHPPADVLPIL